MAGPARSRASTRLAELARVEAMTALTLQHIPRGETIQLLTWHVVGARDLPGVHPRMGLAPAQCGGATLPQLVSAVWLAVRKPLGLAARSRLRTRA